jgi:hypothetical protein
MKLKPFPLRAAGRPCAIIRRALVDVNATPTLALLIFALVIRSGAISVFPAVKSAAVFRTVFAHGESNISHAI